MISPKQVKSELLWYYHQSSADLGISSNFGSIISQGCGFSQSDNYYENKLIAIIGSAKSPLKRLRKIERALRMLPLKQRRIIEALYGEYQYPPQIISVFGEKAGAILFNSKITKLQELLQLCSRKLSKRRLTEQDKSNIQFMINEADETTKQAHQYYWSARNETDRS